MCKNLGFSSVLVYKFCVKMFREQLPCYIQWNLVT